MTTNTPNTGLPHDDHSRIRDGVETVKETVAHSLDKTKEVTAHALDVSKAKASEAARSTSQAIDANPLTILVGGLALGAIVGALIPRSAREKTLLKPLGAKIGAAAAMAVAAAREAGSSELHTLGLDPASMRGQAKTLFEGLGKVASTAGAAAAKKATGKTEG
ncbi:hypothetical protein ASE75_08525 [Sphingomonas sp. Leaf17]|uniref:hypothetical protein n=1 Tax=Sphingomonas sp. Leaf17 TaxID=1735683 RepID=UPI0006F7C412|nr:hypothetical protein [Sphingomonas sp. Leaf17]KQM65079.1 hypothetical protein ASE75_08525 [Sphingomonas sp. Leaf17]